MASSPEIPTDALSDNKTAYTLTAAEFAMGNELMQRSNFQVAGVIVPSIVLGCAVSLFLPGDPPGRLDMAIRVVTMSLAIFCGLLAITKLKRFRNRRRAVTNYRLSPFYHERCVFEWNDEGVRVETDSGYQLYRWKYIRAWCEDDRIMVLFFGPHIYIYLPKRALTPQMTEGLKNRLDQAGLHRAKLFPI
ncbi:YcxB family protein [Rhizobium tumorigenes]|uniref:YcxB family protein n=1 Tax=Rhizobium tumorigenes TaxID=2041385 RepID=A0AAF1KR61_9HYPH|nr:YcxB family protein [Rhizobium tumorigenes]WFR94195.1 YcxB family protein [Rhizobium tumorigenes]